MIVSWDPRIQPRNSGIHKRARSVAGSSSMLGVSQIIASNPGCWVAQFSEFPIVTPERIKIWRALEGQINGRVNPVVVPICDMNRKPKPWGQSDIPYDTGAFFDDGTGYTGPAFVASAYADAALRATTLLIQTVATNIDMPEPGHFFSIGQRLYSITMIDDVVGQITTAQIFPPLREAVIAGEFLDFYRPVCRMKLATDEEMDLNLENRKHGFPSINLIEDTSSTLSLFGGFDAVLFDDM